MSCSRRCDFFKAKDGQWYVTLGNFEHAHDADECTNYGPFADEDAAEDYVFNNHSNPGGSCTDESGTREVPSDVVSPRPRGFAARSPRMF